MLDSLVEVTTATGDHNVDHLPTDRMSLNPSERVLRARLAAYTLHAKYDPRETTAAARAAFLDRFARQVDPEGTLPQHERTRRAEAARKAYFTRLALKSAQARRTRSASR